MARKSRSDSAASAVQAMLNAAKQTPQPPAHTPLRQGDEPFWEGIVRSRAVDEWTETDLVLASQLARCQRDIEVEQGLLYREGTTLVNERGTVVVNPRGSVLELYSRRQLSLMRSLKMVGVSTGDPRDLTKKRTLERQSRLVRLEVEDDGLLA